MGDDADSRSIWRRHFPIRALVPCGIADYPVTSLDEMGMTNVQTRFDLALQSGLSGFLSSLEGGTGGG